MMEKTFVTNKLDILLKKWNFPQSIIDNYKSNGIIEIFEWQNDCLNNSLVLGENSIKYFLINTLNKCSIYSF